ncbi:hypothetical protein DPSP01_007088 [Paraphaeosphaeria sporulosa]
MSVRFCRARGDSAGAGGRAAKRRHVPARFTAALARFWRPHTAAAQTDQASDSAALAALLGSVQALHACLVRVLAAAAAHRHFAAARPSARRAAGQRGVRATVAAGSQRATRDVSIIGPAVRRNGPWSELPTPLASSLLRRRAKGQPEPCQTIMPSPDGRFAEICPAMMPSRARDRRQHRRRLSPMAQHANQRRRLLAAAHLDRR